MADMLCEKMQEFAIEMNRKYILSYLKRYS